MKPISLTTPKRRSFPLVDYNYQVMRLDGYHARCVRSAVPSFRNISRHYFQNEARRDFVSEAFLFALIIVGGSAIVQHGICPHRVLSSNRSALISRDHAAKNKRRNDCASWRIYAEPFLNGRAAPRCCSEKAQAPHHDHCGLRARFNSGDDCNLPIETRGAERGSFYRVDRYG